MAFYSSNYPYYYAQNIPSESGYNNLYYPQSQINYPDSNFNDPRYFYYNYPTYDSRSSVSYYSNEYHYAPSKSLVAYSTTPGDGYYYYDDKTLSALQSVVYRSVSKPIEDLEFEEYDPDPYDGGYDMVRTYGKPLSTDDKICYPRSSFNPNAPHPDALPFTPVFAPYGNNQGVGDGAVVEKKNDRSGSDSKQQKEELDGKGSDHGGLGGSGVGGAGTAAGAGAIAVIASGVGAGGVSAHDNNTGMREGVVEDADDETGDDEDDDDYFSDGTEEEDTANHELSLEATKEDEMSTVKPPSQEDEMREYGKKVYNMPPGCGLDSLDLCEGFFGYWPCLSKMTRDEPTIGHGNDYNRQGNLVADDQWQMTADYLFGDPNPYAHGSGGYEGPVQAYHRDYYQEPSSLMVTYD